MVNGCMNTSRCPTSGLLGPTTSGRTWYTTKRTSPMKSRRGLRGVGEVVWPVRGKDSFEELGTRLCVLGTTHTPRFKLMQQTAAELAVLLDGNVKGSPTFGFAVLPKLNLQAPDRCPFSRTPSTSVSSTPPKRASSLSPKRSKPANLCGLTLLRVQDPYRAFARLLEAYDAVLKRQGGSRLPLWMRTPCWAAALGPSVVIEHGAVIGTCWIARPCPCGTRCKDWT